MDIGKLLLTQPVPSPSQLENLDKIAGLPEEKKKQIAKDFESIFIQKILGEMHNTVGDWGSEKDGASEQVQGIFELYMAADIANNGGFGLWKDLYQFFTHLEQVKTNTTSLDKSV